MFRFLKRLAFFRLHAHGDHPVRRHGWRRMAVATAACSACRDWSDRGRRLNSP